MKQENELKITIDFEESTWTIRFHTFWHRVSPLKCT